ncbi:hypothetical protein COCVIDRAFT_101976 [Bipolaris victoriae FI3]|uniref:Uncharacterized protein n=1 Tax=Bipolaris victoriae (strain FI3) TaxID=930091 RepID=W7E6K8_BIPV3|nr:hypothetical protein COCVIDRAFT_101976 [Bipolaris victoriae FI3]
MLAAHADGRVCQRLTGVYMVYPVQSSVVSSNTRMPGPAVVLEEVRAWHPNVICRSPSQRRHPDPWQRPRHGNGNA